MTNSMNDDELNLRVLSAIENEKNGFTVVIKDLGDPTRRVMHYSVDPDKDPSTQEGRRWYREMRKRIPDKALWMREYEGDPLSHVGKAIFPDFTREKHVKEIEPIKDLHLIRGWDPGWRCSAAVWMQIVEDKKGCPQLRIYEEMQAFGAEFSVLRDRAISKTAMSYPGYESRIWDEIDIGGLQHNQSSKQTAIDILGQKAIVARYQKSSKEDRILVLSYLLNNTTSKGEPAFLIHPRCHRLIAGFLGLYRRKEGSEEIDKTEVVHLMDALGYGSYNNLFLKFQGKKEKEKKRGLSAGDWFGRVIGKDRDRKVTWLNA